MEAPLVTLFTTCKAFEGENAVMQRNALNSWATLDLPILLIGDDPGTREQASAIGAKHLAQVKTNEHGTPLISDLFTVAKTATTTPFLAYINSDIILTQDFFKVVQTLKGRNSHQPTLAVTRRFNIPNTPLNFEKNWQRTLSVQASRYGSWDKDNAIDLFLFNRELFSDIPDFAIGRMQWDNWLLWKAQNEKATIIDCSLELTPYHPIHGYYGKNASWLTINQGGEATENRRIAQGLSCSINDVCTHALTDKGIQPLSEGIKQRVEMHCKQDTEKEFIAGVEYLSSIKLPPEDKIECIKTLLWRRGKYFPFTFSPSFIESSVIKEAKTLAIAGQVNESESLLQDTLNELLINELKLQYQKNRPIFIWGAGTFGRMAKSILESRQITLSGALDSNAASLRMLDGIEVFPPEHVLNSKHKPYILITTMYADDVVKQLVKHNYQEALDYAL